MPVAVAFWFSSQAGVLSVSLLEDAAALELFLQIVALILCQFVVSESR